MTPSCRNWKRSFVNVGFFSITMKTELGTTVILNYRFEQEFIYESRCFPHVVNLACQAVLGALTNLDYAREPQTNEEQTSFLEAVEKDPIATLRALIRTVSGDAGLVPQSCL